MSLTKREMESQPGWGERIDEEVAAMDEEAAYQAAFPVQFQDRNEPCPDEGYRPPYISLDEWGTMTNPEKWLAYFTWGDEVRDEPTEADLAEMGRMPATPYEPSDDPDDDELPF